MKATHRKKGIQGLLLAFIIVGAVFLWKSGQDRPDASSPTAETGVDKPQTARDVQEAPADLKFSAVNPLYFRMVFGEGNADSMLGAVDESGGPGTEYNVAFLDENNNGDLTDEVAMVFTAAERPGESGFDPRFDFNGPLKDGKSGEYTLNIISLGNKNFPKTDENDYYFFWYLDTEDWHYMFIFGKMRLSASVAEAQEAPPIRLGGPCAWEISAGRENGKATVSAGLKDENGCTLRVLSQPGKDLSPKLSLIQDGKVVAEQAMEFG